MSSAELDRRIKHLQEFQNRVLLADVENDGVFQLLVQSVQTVLEMSDSELANNLSISRPTFNRWVNGRTAPHRAARRAAKGWIGEQLALRLRRLRAEQRQS